MTTREMVTAALLAALIAAGALAAIPLEPVPFTFQVLFVMMAGLLLRPGAAAACVSVYLLMGAVGLPVFSKGQAGLGVLAGPTGGFLFGFLIGAVAVSVIAGPASARTSFVWRLSGCLLGLGAIYSVGAAWLATVTGMGLTKALVLGVLPFIPLDVFKASVATVGVEALQRVRRTAPARL